MSLPVIRKKGHCFPFDGDGSLFGLPSWSPSWELEIPVLFDSRVDCCGCTACMAICPKNAIKMKEDEEGFLYPCIDRNECINCRRCISVCPIGAKRRGEGGH